MTITYRSSGAWGPGKGANLTPSEVDGNFHDLATRVAVVEENPIAPAQIASITSSGSALTITMDNSDVHGPLTLPVAAFLYRGAWAAGTAYARNDVVTVGGSLYLVTAAHSSDGSFNPGRIIAGTAVYQLMFDADTASVAAVGAALEGGTHTGIAFTYDSASNAISADVTVAAYTDEMARDAIAAALAAGTHTGIAFSHDDTANSISAAVAVTQYTDEMAQDAVAAALAAGTHSGISFAYNDSAGAISATVTGGGVTVQEGGTTVLSSASTLNFDAAGFNVTTAGGIATIAASAAVAGGIDVREGSMAVVSAANAIDFDAAGFNVTNIGGVPTVALAASSGITAGTVQASTSGTAKEWTGLPSGIRRITVMFKGVSTSGTDKIVVQLGTASGFVITGYVGSASVNGTVQSNITAGLATSNHSPAADARHGLLQITNLGGNDWVSSATIGLSNGASVGHGASSVTLSAALDRIRVTTTLGADSFDAGSLNILFE